MSNLYCWQQLSSVAVLVFVACVTSPAGAQDGEYGYEVRRYDTVILQGRRELDGPLPPSDPAYRRSLGYLPERLILPDRMTVRGLLALHARLAGLDPSAIPREADEAMERVGVADRAGDRIGDLSKGLRQRVGFAQAFLGRPGLVLLDEPTSGLDPIGMRDSREWVQALRERGATVLISSHVLSEVERTCDRIAILNEGRMVANGSLAEVIGDSATLEDAFVRLVRS